MSDRGELVRIGELSRLLEIPVPQLRRWADAGAIPVARTSDGGHRFFDPTRVRAALAGSSRGDYGAQPLPPDRPAEFVAQYDLRTSAEDEIWTELAAHLTPDVGERARRILAYAVTEMANNAIDHSGGDALRAGLWVSADTVVFQLQDDGEGAFAHVRRGLGLEDDFEAIAALSKGRQTTAKARHSGEGIFFTSKALDLFRLEANGLRWTVDSLRNDVAVGQSGVEVGTRVTGQLDPHTTRTTRSVFEAYTEDHEFIRSRPVLRLFEIGRLFVSRSEAKRLLTNMDGFTEIEVDFAGVEEVGQGFVDELFRVWPSTHPGTTVHPLNMNPAVEWMVRRGLRR